MLWHWVFAVAAAVATAIDLRSTHIGIGLGLREVGKVARKWGLRTLLVLNVIAWLLLTFGGWLLPDPAPAAACSLLLCAMAVAHVVVWQRNVDKIERRQRKR